MVTFNEITDKIYDLADKSATIYNKISTTKAQNKILENNVIPIREDVRYSTSGYNPAFLNEESANERLAQNIQTSLLIGSGVLLVVGVSLVIMGGRK